MKPHDESEPFFITEKVEAELAAAGYEFEPPAHVRTKSISRPLKKCSSNAPGSRISKKRVAQTRLRNECEGHFGLFAGRFARFGRTYPMAHA